MAISTSRHLSAVPSELPTSSAGGSSSYLQVFAAEGGTSNVCDIGRSSEYLTTNGLELESTGAAAVLEEEEEEEEEEKEGEDEEVQKSGTTAKKVEPLGCLNSLEDSLPIKRGLSNFYNGKSRSFASLSESAAAKTEARELAKPENPFNKKRRILMYSWQRTASCSSLLTSPFPPLPTHDLSSLEESEEEDEEEERERGEMGPLPSALHRRRKMVNDRSFSLSDLQQHPNISS